MDYGFEAVVVLPLRRHLPQQLHQAGPGPGRRSTPEVGRALLDAVTADPSLELTIDVARGTVEAPAAGIEATFPLDEFTRERLLNGWDDIGLTLRHEAEIDAYEAHRPGWLPRSAAAPA